MKKINSFQKETMASRSGFSLVELMVATAISSIVALSFASMFSDSARQTHVLKQQIEVVAIQQQVTLAIGNKKTCVASFKNVVVSPNNSFAVDRIYLAVDPSTGAGISPIIYRGMPPTLTNLKLNSIQLADVKATGTAGVFSASLVAIFDSNSGPTLHINVPLMLQTDGAGNISSCAGGAGSNGGQGPQVGYTDSIPQGGDCGRDPLPNTPRYYYTCTNQPPNCAIFNFGFGGFGGGGFGGGGFGGFGGGFGIPNLANAYLNGQIANPDPVNCPNGPDVTKCTKIDVTPPNNPVSNWVQAPMGYLGANRGCYAFVGRAASTYRYNSSGCYYDPKSGWIYACSNDTSIRCGYICVD